MFLETSTSRNSHSFTTPTETVPVATNCSRHKNRGSSTTLIRASAATIANASLNATKPDSEQRGRIDAERAGDPADKPDSSDSPCRLRCGGRDFRECREFRERFLRV